MKLRVVAESGTQEPQTGKLFYGPGAAKKHALPRLDSYQEECLKKAKKYAVDQNVKISAVRQTIMEQQQVCCV